MFISYLLNIVRTSESKHEHSTSTTNLALPKQSVVLVSINLAIATIWIRPFTHSIHCIHCAYSSTRFNVNDDAMQYIQFPTEVVTMPTECASYRNKIVAKMPWSNRPVVIAGLALRVVEHSSLSNESLLLKGVTKYFVDDDG